MKHKKLKQPDSTSNLIIALLSIGTLVVSVAVVTFSTLTLFGGAKIDKEHVAVAIIWSLIPAVGALAAVIGLWRRSIVIIPAIASLILLCMAFSSMSEFHDSYGYDFYGGSANLLSSFVWATIVASPLTLIGLEAMKLKKVQHYRLLVIGLVVFLLAFGTLFVLPQQISFNNTRSTTREANSENAERERRLEAIEDQKLQDQERLRDVHQQDLDIALKSSIRTIERATSADNVLPNSINPPSGYQIVEYKIVDIDTVKFCIKPVDTEAVYQTAYVQPGALGTSKNDPTLYSDSGITDSCNYSRSNYEEFE